METVKALLAGSHYLQAYEEATAMLAADEHGPADQVELLQMAARAAAVGLGQPRVAHELAARAVAVAQAAGLWAQAQMMRVEAGEALRRCGEWPEAAAWFEAFLSHDQDTVTDKRCRGTCLYNYGLVHRARQDYARAVSAFEAAADAFARERMLVQMGAAYRMLAWTHLLLTGRAALAEPRGSDGPSESAVTSDADRVHQITLEALHSLRIGDFDQALHLCQEVLTPDRVGVTDLSRAEAAMVAVEVALHSSHWTDACSMADLAAEAAAASGHPAVVKRAGELAVKVKEAAPSGQVAATRALAGESHTEEAV